MDHSVAVSRKLTSASKDASEHVERLLNKPSAVIWLTRVRLKTSLFEEALSFYSDLIGLPMRELTAEAETGRVSAHFLDAYGNDVLQIDEAGDAQSASGLEMTFCIPLRGWHLFRARVRTQSYPHEESDSRIRLQDVDGNMIEVRPLDDSSN